MTAAQLRQHLDTRSGLKAIYEQPINDTSQEKTS